MINDNALNLLRNEEQKLIRLIDQGVDVVKNELLLLACKKAITERTQELIKVSTPERSRNVSPTFVASSSRIVLGGSSLMVVARNEWQSSLKDWREARDHAEKLRLIKRRKWKAYEKFLNKEVKK